MYFNTEDGSLTSTFKFNAEITEATEIYMYFDLWYPDGYTARSDTEGFTFTRVGSTNYMTLSHPNPQSVHGKDVSIAITRKNTDMKETSEGHVKVHIKGSASQSHMKIKIIDKDFNNVHESSVTEVGSEVQLKPLVA